MRGRIRISSNESISSSSEATIRQTKGHGAAFKLRSIPKRIDGSMAENEGICKTFYRKTG
jgi:hypothetical protein